MGKILKAAGLWLVIAAIVWLTTIWRWQGTGHEPGNAEIVVRLFVLPVALAAAVFGALWAVERLRAKASGPVGGAEGGAGAAAAALGQAAAAAQGQTAIATAASERQLTAWILAEAVHLSAGDDAMGAWSALQAGAVRPQLDKALQDVDGAPVMAGRVADLEMPDGEALRADVAAHAADGPTELSPVVQRGLALLSSPLQRLLWVIGELVPSSMAGEMGQGLGEGGRGAGAMVFEGASTKAHLSGVATPVPEAVRRDREAMAPQLTLRLLMPPDWPPAEREVVVARLRRQSGVLLDWADAVGARGVVWRTEPLAHPEQFWDEFDQTVLQWSRHPRPELLAVLAVDSALDEACIERMQGLGELFTATHQRGRMPGEGAAALLLANAHWPGVTDGRCPLPRPPVRVWRPARSRREKSADAAGRVGTAALQASVVQAIELSGIDKDRPDAITVVADADHRASRTAELYESLQEALPGLDPMLAVTRVGDGCGELGMARALVPAALACAALLDRDDAAARAMAIHLQSSHDRVVVALAPWRPAAAAA